MPQSWRTSRYTEFVKRLEGLDQEIFTVGEIGTLEDYLIFLVETKKSKGKINILLTAGIHGDEPAGTEAIMEALESGFLKKWAGKFNFSIIPCINPTGYDLGTRENENGIDINRTFDSDKVDESRFVKKFLAGKKFDLFIEFHEDWEYDGYYLYELSKNAKTLCGKKIIKELQKKGLPIHEGEADGRPTKNGLVVTGDKIPAEIMRKVMALYVYTHTSDHIITSESPSKMNIESRILMHLTALDIVLTESSKK
jgi:hypothetical protein